jgi:hypothetical protein
MREYGALQWHNVCARLLKKVNSVSHLIISNSIDYSTDLICLELEKRGNDYLRLNRDQFGEYAIEYSLRKNTLTVKIDGTSYLVSNESLQSVYFRAPVFLRSNKVYSLDEQLYRSQWSSFIRNLIVFDKCKWVNHPVATYKAENKMYQLKMASEAGLTTPNTVVTNCRPSSIEDNNYYIIKSLDTALFQESEYELFTYSTLLQGSQINDSELRAAPVILQECLINKVDIRVTIIDNNLYPVKITKNGSGINGDWRKFSKETLEYTPIQLPFELEKKIHALMHLLDLSFGGLDLAIWRDEYCFIEVNPTGEWGWLNKSPHYSLDSVIVDCLTKSFGVQEDA